MVHALQIGHVEKKQPGNKKHHADQTAHDHSAQQEHAAVPEGERQGAEKRDAGGRGFPFARQQRGGDSQHENQQSNNRSNPASPLRRVVRIDPITKRQHRRDDQKADGGTDPPFVCHHTRALVIVVGHLVTERVVGHIKDRIGGVIKYGGHREIYRQRGRIQSAWHPPHGGAKQRGERGTQQHKRFPPPPS